MNGREFGYEEGFNAGFEKATEAEIASLKAAVELGRAEERKNINDELFRQHVRSWQEGFEFAFREYLEG